MNIIHLEQNTPQWLSWRQGGIGGSDAPAIMGVSPWDTPLSLWLRRKGHLPRKMDTLAMQRGHDLEPIAREKAAAEIGMMFNPMCGQHDKFPFLRASFDGVELGMRALQEIKAPAVEEHELALNNLVPAKYWPQVQHQMMVSKIKKTYYVSYRPEAGRNDELAIVEVDADREYQKRLFAAEKAWWGCFTEDRMPVEKDEVFAALAWRPLKQLARQYKSMEEEVRKELLAKTGVAGEEEVTKDLGPALIKVSSRIGEVDYDALFQAYGIDDAVLDKFRKPSSLVTRVTLTNHLKAKVTKELLLQ